MEVCSGSSGGDRLLGCKPFSTPMEANEDYGLMAITFLMIQKGIEE